MTEHLLSARVTYPRRTFLARGAAVAGSLVAGCRTAPQASENSDPIARLDRWIENAMKADRVPGLSACCVRGGKIVWARAYGWANVDAQTPMSPDTIQNIASISKTVTATAVMQLWQQGRFGLDDDVASHAGFPIRNPHHPDLPITFRQLLNHTAAINDGPAYDESYAAGDPTVPLAEWVVEYLSPAGRFYDASTNFHPHRPGTKHRYSNVAFGLLGYLVEVLSGEPFNEYCRKHIFQPLGMDNTGWFLREVDLARHATPYRYLSPKEAQRMTRPPALLASVPKEGGFAPYTLYSFPNYPDGLLRTSVRDFARFLIANLKGGIGETTSILQPAAFREIFSVQFGQSDEPGREQGLAWVGRKDKQGRAVWSHSGGDPGVSTFAAIRPADGVGAVACANAGTALPQRLVQRLLGTPPSAPEATSSE